MKITEKDFEIQWFSGTGGGGQHRNRHPNCARAIHKETGIKAQATSSKSRKTNKRNAIAVCTSRVVAHFSEDTERYRATEERVRTYHEPDNRVVDHLSGKQMSYKECVLNENIAPVLEARRISLVE